MILFTVFSIITTHATQRESPQRLLTCGGVFEQLARYTTRYQESDLHLAFILLNLLTTTAYSTSPYFSYSLLLSSSGIVAVLIAKAGHVWVS